MRKGRLFGQLYFRSPKPFGQHRGSDVARAGLTVRATLGSHCCVGFFHGSGICEFKFRLTFILTFLSTDVLRDLPNLPQNFSGASPSAQPPTQIGIREATRAPLYNLCRVSEGTSSCRGGFRRRFCADLGPPKKLCRRAWAGIQTPIFVGLTGDLRSIKRRVCAVGNPSMRRAEFNICFFTRPLHARPSTG